MSCASCVSYLLFMKEKLLLSHLLQKYTNNQIELLETIVKTAFGKALYFWILVHNNDVTASWQSASAENATKE